MERDEWAPLLAAAQSRALDYLGDVDARRVAPDPAAVAALEALGGPLAEQGLAPIDVLHRLDAIASPATVATAGRRYFGYVIGGALPATVAAQWLASAWDQCATYAELSPAAAKLEQVALAWVLSCLGLPPETAGGFVTGATMANFTALAAARHALLERQGWNVEAHGLFGAPPLRVVVGDKVHATVLKALQLLGLGRERVERVPVDAQGRIRVDLLPALDERTILCLSAGIVETGAFDAFEPLIERARAARAWVHVDGAFGLWAAASPAFAHSTRGVHAADSFAVDAHKWLNTPYDCGLALVRDGQALRTAMAIGPAAYLTGAAGEQRQPGHYVAELSRRARGVEVWAALAQLGRGGVAALVERTCALARRAADALVAHGWEIVNDVVLNQVLVRFGDDDATRRTITALQQDGTCWCGGATWHGRQVMRISVSSWQTTEADIDVSVATMDRLARNVGATPARSAA